MIMQVLRDEWEYAWAKVLLMAHEWLLSKSENPPAQPKKAPRNALTAVYHDLIPGWASLRQACPEDCSYNDHLSWRGKTPLLQSTIIHLNDHHKWTRERIADWLETLDHDLTFKTPEEVNR